MSDWVDEKADEVGRTCIECAGDNDLEVCPACRQLFVDALRAARIEGLKEAREIVSKLINEPYKPTHEWWRDYMKARNDCMAAIDSRISELKG